VFEDKKKQEEFIHQRMLKAFNSNLDKMTNAKTMIRRKKEEDVDG